jgi:putative SOS response-associated peptidase YedK
MPSERRAPDGIGMADHGPFALAGIWKELADPKTGELIDAYVVITCAPNEMMAQLHDRMPLIIASNDYDRWLSADAPPADPAPAIPGGTDDGL